MLEHDDGDDYIAELIDELLENVDKIIYANYIESWLIPYTVLQAKDVILQIIEVPHIRYIYIYIYIYIYTVHN